MQMSMGTGELAYKLTLGKPDGGQVFQAQKFAGTEHEDWIQLVKLPMEAAILGKDK
ncbi:hypothetical protein [Cytobacillus praedii]|uniref:hypothetical protein n=1 Tax=Cytobacillus praedii TaxID=1742358 RepID=UPI003F81D6D0